jgi:hypothetical protein
MKKSMYIYDATRVGIKQHKMYEGSEIYHFAARWEENQLATRSYSYMIMYVAST